MVVLSLVACSKSGDAGAGKPPAPLSANAKAVSEESSEKSEDQTMEKKKELDKNPVRPQAEIDAEEANMRKWLPRYIKKYTWPPRYTATADSLWRHVAPGAIDTNFQESDAESEAGFWNLCAWVNEARDRLATPGGDLTEVSDAFGEWMRVKDPEGWDKAFDGIVKDFQDALRLGDPTAFEDYEDANQCSNFPR